MAYDRAQDAGIWDGLAQEFAPFGLALTAPKDLTVLGTPRVIGDSTAPNRLMIHPMEGCDGETDGRPGPLTIRRYERFAAGGAGLLWVEACAVVGEGRANARQLWLTPENIGHFAALVETMRSTARAHYGEDFRPLLVLQLTHSGRYSKPEGRPAPLIAHHSPLDEFSHVDAALPVLSDGYLDDLQGAYVQSARLAQEAGFDAVDVKACHRYLISELLASFTREGSRYGGAYENRTRLLREVVREIRQAAPELMVTSRLNVFDAFAYPYGWGMAPEGLQPDLSEPLRLVGELQALGVALLNVTVGNPYFRPHYNRPYDRPIEGGYLPEETPLASIARFQALTRGVQQAYPQLAVAASGLSWLRTAFPAVAAALLEQGWATLAGLGREGFAYPDFARDILTGGAMDAQRCCIACSHCSQMMRDGVESGCPVRDAAVYGPIYRRGRAAAKG